MNVLGSITEVSVFLSPGIICIWENKDGSKKSRGNYVNGKKTGKWLFWNNNKLIEADFKDNKLIKTIELSTNQIVESSEIK